jgi:N-acetylgalactosamine kinase
VQLVRREFPQFAPLIRFVRDISCETLRVPPQRIYEILAAVPESMTAAEVRATFSNDPEAWAALEAHFADVADQVEYPVRGVLMFGITECARARRAADCLRRGDMAELGHLMNISHDGERCFRAGSDGEAQQFCVDVSAGALANLCRDLESEAEDRVARAQLHQHG